MQGPSSAYQLLIERALITHLAMAHKKARTRG